MAHAIIRTSPTGKGQKFVGRCMKCNQEGLGVDAALLDCPKDDVMYDEQMLFDILDNKVDVKSI